MLRTLYSSPPCGKTCLSFLNYVLSLVCWIDERKLNDLVDFFFVKRGQMRMARFHYTKFLTVCGLVAGIATMLCASTASAGWHWHGSHGGYSSFGTGSGSWGGYGGSYGGSHGGSYGGSYAGSWGGGGSGGGSYGGGSGGYSSHGSHGGRVGLLARLHSHHRSRGSHGSHGSSGGYSSSWGSSGGSSGYSGGSSGGSYYGSNGGGSSGGYGSTGYGSGGGYGNGGGVIYQSPVVPNGVQAAPQDGVVVPEGKVEPNQGAMKVQVPEDALVYVNGILTKSTGESRSYVSRGLVSGFQYSYEVRAEAIRDGKKVEESKTVSLKAGETLSLAFDNLQATNAQETTLTIKVPADAKVSLGGNPTNGEGTVRVFSTTKLGSNNEWSNYVVQVTVDRNGQTVTQEKNVTLKAGDNQTLSFDFDSTQVASTR